VNEKISEQPSHRIESLSAFLVTLRVAQSERGCVASAEDNVVIVKLSDDLVGLTQEFRERLFNDSRWGDDI
jgi:hypothetical protein